MQFELGKGQSNLVKAFAGTSCVKASQQPGLLKPVELQLVFKQCSRPSCPCHAGTGHCSSTSSFLQDFSTFLCNNVLSYWEVGNQGSQFTCVRTMRLCRSKLFLFIASPVSECVQCALAPELRAARGSPATPANPRHGTGTPCLTLLHEMQPTSLCLLQIITYLGNIFSAATYFLSLFS